MKSLLTSLLFCILFLVSFSQSEHYAQPAFPHHATVEERQMLKTWYRNVKDGPVPTAPVTAIAEFQPMGGVMVAYPLGIPVNLVSELSFITKVKVLVYPASDSNTVKTYFASSGVNMDNVSFWVINNDSYWTRDDIDDALKGNDAPQEISFDSCTRHNPSYHYPVFVKIKLEPTK